MEKGINLMPEDIQRMIGKDAQKIISLLLKWLQK
jgi:hypothetical protein